jgi:uncharacterized membrane protein
VNRGWIGPSARVALGGLASTIVFSAGLWLRSRFGETHSAFAAVGVGIAGGYATLLAATALYGLLPNAAGLVVSVGIALGGTATALAWRSELIAGLGLIGAALAPLAIAAEDGLSPRGAPDLDAREGDVDGRHARRRRQGQLREIAEKRRERLRVDDW